MSDRRHNTPEEIVKIVQGFIDGKTVLARLIYPNMYYHDRYKDLFEPEINPGWNFASVEYKLKD